MKNLILVILICLQQQLLAQTVPSKIDFAGMELKLTKGAIDDIQTTVNALTRSDAYFQKQLEKADMYLPIIARIFREEGLPEDFKYLVIQESALIPDAVSSSNAVGFWQFKEISGLEMDLRIDRFVDERMNIVSASRAAAGYLKKHNKQFDNWAYSLIAYQRGVAGARSVINEKYFGEKKMPISKKTYWYLKKFLAHKVAFEKSLNSSTPTYFLKELQQAEGKSLKQIAADEKIDLSLLEDYNKWLKRGSVPSDKNYTVIVPLDRALGIAAENKKITPTIDLPREVDITLQRQYPIIVGAQIEKNPTIAHEIRVNGLKGIVAAQGYTLNKLAEKAGLSVEKFRNYNDMSANQKVEVGKIYYLQRKRNRARLYYHTVQPNESMWSISQKYGLKLHKLYRKNRIKAPANPKIGRVLWLRLNRPASVPVEYKDNKEQFEPSEKNKLIKSVPKAEGNAKIAESNEEIGKEANKDSIIIAEKADVPLDLSATDSSDIGLKSTSIQNTDTPALNSASDSEAEPATMKLDPADKPVLTPYTIKKGDTFFAISNRFNMRISDLLSYNELSIRDTLSIGQQIMVSKPIKINDQKSDKNSAPKKLRPPKDSNLIKHSVTSGDTLYGLAKRYDVSLNDLLLWNDKKDYNLKEGEVLIIKTK